MVPASPVGCQPQVHLNETSGSMNPPKGTNGWTPKENTGNDRARPVNGKSCYHHNGWCQTQLLTRHTTTPNNFSALNGRAATALIDAGNTHLHEQGEVRGGAGEGHDERQINACFIYNDGGGDDGEGLTAPPSVVMRDDPPCNGRVCSCWGYRRHGPIPGGQPGGIHPAGDGSNAQLHFIFCVSGKWEQMGPNGRPQSPPLTESVTRQAGMTPLTEKTYRHRAIRKSPVVS